MCNRLLVPKRRTGRRLVQKTLLVRRKTLAAKTSRDSEDLISTDNVMARVPFVGSRQLYTSRWSESLVERETVSLRRTFPLFLVGYDLDGLIRCRRRDWR
jgi:hypothetical protein